MELERIELSVKERERLKLLHEVEQGVLEQIEAARRCQSFSADHLLTVR